MLKKLGFGSKSTQEDEKSTQSVDSAQDVEQGTVENVPEGGLSSFRYNSPATQVIITACVAFGCPGMYNSITGLGAGGTVDVKTVSTGNYTLYAVSAVCYLFVAPIVYHFVGARWCMLVSGFIGYPLYTGSLLAYKYIESKGFIIGASAVLGVLTTTFWTASGAVLTGMPLPSEAGVLAGLYWLIFNMGGTIGSFISFGINFDTTQETVSTALYAVFMALEGGLSLLAIFLLPERRIIRNDGSHVRPVEEAPNVLKDFVKILKILPRKETIVLLPLFFSSNYCYPYQQNTVNLRLFDTRTRGFNAAFYWFGALLSPVLGFGLDNKRFSRKKTALLGYGLIVVLMFTIFGGGLALQLRSAPNDTISMDATLDSHYLFKLYDMDVLRSGTKFAGPFILYFCYGIFDSLYQTYVYWIISVFLSTDDEDGARYVGLYKAFQGIGSSCAYAINSKEYPYTTEFATNWGLVGGSLFIMLPFFYWIQEPVKGAEAGYLESSAPMAPTIYAVRSDQSQFEPKRSHLNPKKSAVEPTRTIEQALS